MPKLNPWVRAVFDIQRQHSKWVRVLGVAHSEPAHRSVVKGVEGLYRSFPKATPLYRYGLPTSMTIIEWRDPDG